jgi:hypothetical protein
MPMLVRRVLRDALVLLLAELLAGAVRRLFSLNC